MRSRGARLAVEPVGIVVLMSMLTAGAIPAAPAHRALQRSSDPCGAGVAHFRTKSGSLDFFGGSYAGHSCSWTITCPLNGKPVLTFTEFDTEAGYDWVDVFAGSDASGRLSSRLAHLSGSGLAAISAGPYRTRTHSMRVQFTADQLVDGQGFTASYSCADDAFGERHSSSAELWPV